MSASKSILATLNQTGLPIVEKLEAIRNLFSSGSNGVLQADPGAGKTTLAPLALLDIIPSDEKIILLEPRRLAARNAALRMADLLGEKVGQSIGYRIKNDLKVSKNTRIEVITEGILTRMLQSDPELPGIAMIIFDEFHERSLDADLGLANCDVMLGLRVERNLSHVLSGECELDEILVEGPAGIKIVPATSGSQSMVELSPSEHAGLIRAFSELNTEFDILIVDTAAGISDMVLSFSRAAQDVVVVVCDEPTSITDAYALIKVLSREHGVYKFKIVANMVRSMREGDELFTKLTKVTNRFLDVALELVAVVPFDENVRKSVRKQKAIVEAFPSSPAALAIRKLANKAVGWPIPSQPGGHLEFFLEQLVTKKAVGETR